MTDETNGAGLPDAEDTAAVLSRAAGDKTYLGEQTQAETLEPQDEPIGEDANAAPTDDDAQAEQPKAKKSAKERIDELTWRLRETERQLAQARGQTPAHPAQEAQPTDGKPDPQAYENGVSDPQYIEDLTDWKAAQTVERHFSQREAQAKQQTGVQTFKQRVQEQFPDGEPDGLRAILSMPTLPGAVQEVLMESEIGPKLADYLGENQRELARLSALPPIQQARELTKLEQKLATPPAPPQKIATDAPEPAPTLRGAGGRFRVAPDTSDFAAFEAQYKPGG